MKIICLGDSFTRGFGVKDDESWVSLLSRDNALDHITLINKGINGDTTSGMLSRFYHDVVDLSPKYVLITGGTNDFIAGSSLEIPQNNYMSMVHQAFHNGIIPIIGFEPTFSPDSIRSDWAAFSDFAVIHEKHKEFRQWLIKFCHTFGLFHIDFCDIIETMIANDPAADFYLSDGLHLTKEGHRQVYARIVGPLLEII